MNLNKMIRIINSLYMKMRQIKINRITKMRSQMYQIPQKLKISKMTNKKKNND